MSTRMDSPLLTAKQVAAIIGKCVATVRHYANSGVIVVYRVRGNEMRFEPNDVERLQSLLDDGWKPSFKH